MTALLGLGLLAAALAGCTAPSQQPHPGRTLAIAGTTCPDALGRADDVRPASGTGDRLVPLRPAADRALICRYGSVFDQGSGARHTLASHVLLDGAAAARLGSAAAEVRTGPTSGGPAGCPNSTGDVIVIEFGYRDRAPIDLWWETTGCQTIDDGTVEAQQVANDSFGRFQRLLASSTRLHL